MTLGCAAHGFKRHDDCDACSTAEPLTPREALDAITDIVLAYRPKSKEKKPRKCKTKKKRKKNEKRESKI